MQRRPLPPPPPKKPKTLIFICLTLTILLAYAAAINLDLNSELEIAESDKDELRTFLALAEENTVTTNQTINNILEQFLLYNQYQTIQLDDNFTKTNEIQIIEDYIVLVSYNNGTHHAQRYYFPTLDNYSNAYLTTQVD